MSPDDHSDFLLSCRYGDIDDINAFIAHFDALALLLPLLPPALLSAQNASGSTPLHWASLNAHLPIAKALVAHSPGPGVDLIDIKNHAGRSPLGEAEMAGWEEGASWFVEVMNLGEGKGAEGASADEVADADDDAPIHLEIQDADGHIANLTIHDPPLPPS
ncbi:hypothetical protein SERLADRAFT_447412 [Serpula lacrymans var. lacrymans S7.9]|uniref:Ankyrin n=1 Tax=Serpula lacrymans var. lacrymans (strain S7.9) TaxID=578457 RepID=F8NQT5_SERL9|nr:uncharacterized protein SERLADRAFT_447412 [Serpula lacrymans var. lacrymans S7.9]EGO26161.1 hypothetical protein SERLADRAFT_447412 [Serpula lacrymans var. lacrymans S7.9]